MHFKYTILYVEDVTSTIIFYEDVFGFNRKMIHESGEYGELDTGGTTLAFSSHKLMNQLGKSSDTPNPSAPVFEIAFETENVAEALEKARSAGAKIIQEPQQQPWGQTIAYVADNNGFLIEICSPVAGA
ncbi:VOC family protein [Maridesulfovibrio zosterae]|uniref:VOC family protein n=1 Tax=Maridesulfovibrio zosterae TaxID=82171 RepID=UPI00040FBE47|nr:VOC family protein [Maridesulfovibrio zosterae]